VKETNGKVMAGAGVENTTRIGREADGRTSDYNRPQTVRERLWEKKREDEMKERIPWSYFE
jgi:hypothetical protein